MVFSGGCSCFAVTENRGSTYVYLQEFLNANRDEECKTASVLNFEMKCANGVLFIHKELASIFKLPA